MASIMGNVASISQYIVRDRIRSRHDEDWIAEKLAKAGFLAIDETSQESSIGWVCLDDIQDSAFDIRRHFIRSPYVCMTMRKDQRKLPRSVVNMQVEQAKRKWLANNPDFQFIPKDRRNEIKERVISVLMAKALAVPSTIDVVWDLDRDIVYVSSLSVGDLDNFEELFADTFTDLGVVAVHPYARIHRVLDPKHHSALSRLNEANSDDVIDLVKSNLWIGRDFLLWLLYNTVESSSDYRVSVDGPTPKGDPFVAHIDSRLLLLGEDEEDAQRIVYTGPQDKFAEVRAALKRGKAISEATIYLEKDEEVWKLTLKGELFRFASLKAPKVRIERDEITNETEEREAVFYERMYLIESGLQMFDSLLEAFLKLRISKKWTEQLSAINDWSRKSR